MSWRTVFLSFAIWSTIFSVLLYVKEAAKIYFMEASETSVAYARNISILEYEKAERFSHSQPHWLYKLPFMASAKSIADDKRICFVHVGKTAGSTLACYLGFHSDHCATGLNDTISSSIPYTRDIIHAVDTIREMIPKGNLAPHTTSMIHKEYDTCIEDGPMSMYLFVVRNPFARLQSWFDYERIDNSSERTFSYYVKAPLFIDCDFNTLNKLGGVTGLGSKNVSSVCYLHAALAVSGQFGYMAHNKYNYRYYYKKVFSQQQHPRIVVIRTEHLNMDWNNIENKLLGGPPLPQDFAFTHKNKSPKQLEDMSIDDDAKRNICRFLCYEVQVYKKILKQAENIDEAAYKESMLELALDCPTEVSKENCRYL